MALRLPRLPLVVGGAQRVVAMVRAHAGDVTFTVGAVGGDDVVGAAVVERLRVRGDGGPDALGDIGPAASRALPALRALARNLMFLIGKFRSARTLMNSCPTAPVAPTTATFATADMVTTRG